MKPNRFTKLALFALFALSAIYLSQGIASARQVYFPHHGRCHHGYRRVVQHRHKHRVVICVKKTKKSVGVKPLLKSTKLHAHLDPTYTRNPAQPMKVTYDFSASASKESSDARERGADAFVAEESTELPSGVLALYSDGKLECAINVGGRVTGSACPVIYDELGQHQVTTIYTSGEQSATATETEDIKPLPTTTTVGVEFEPDYQPCPTTSCLIGYMVVSFTSSPTWNVASNLHLSLPLGSGEPSIWDAEPVPTTNETRAAVREYGVEACLASGTCAPMSFFNDGTHSLIATRFAGGGYSASVANAPLELGLCEGKSYCLTNPPPA